MAVYTIVAVTKAAKTLHPCWMIDASSANAALRQGHILRDQGAMPWLPPHALLGVRRASLLERRKFAEIMQVRPIGGEITDSSDTARRAERLMKSHFWKLWTSRQGRLARTKD